MVKQKPKTKNQKKYGFSKIKKKNQRGFSKIKKKNQYALQKNENKIKNAIERHVIQKFKFLENIKRNLIYFSKEVINFKKKFKIEKKCFLLVLNLFKNFLIKIGEDSCFISLCNKRILINQDDIINSFAFKKFFKSGEEIFKRRRNILNFKKIKDKNREFKKKTKKSKKYLKNFTNYEKPPFELNHLKYQKNNIGQIKNKSKKKYYFYYKKKLLQSL